MSVAPVSSPSFLNVAQSFSGRRWLARGSDERLALALAQSRALPEIVARVMAARGVSLETAESYLAPTLRALMPDPSTLQDMDTAAERLAAAVRNGEAVAVFGDYDVDGATSSALLFRYLQAAGATPPRLYIPDRITEGYGPNGPALRRLRQQGVSLVLTVDCGTSAFTALTEAAEVGLDVLVLDHHAAEPALPQAQAVVNPNRLDDASGLGTLAAVGVTYLFVVATNRALRRAGWFRDGRMEPDLLGLLDLVALGTICDVVPLTGLNRAMVSQGLKVMARRGNLGLATLADVAGINTPPVAYHAGFVLGPRVNAGGRVGASDLGARLLSTADPVEAQSLARQLDELNAERRALEAEVLEAALAQLAGAPATDLVFVVGQDWHPGVIGIVASRLMERYRRPACVVTLVEDRSAKGGENGGRVGKGSGRSVRGVDLGAAIIAARQAGLLLAGGGHRMAAGFTVAEDKMAALQAFLAARITEQVAVTPLEAVLELDGALSINGATADLAETLSQLGPFGIGNAEPRFALPDIRLVRTDVVGAGGHVRCIATGPGGGRLKAIAFRAADSALGQTLLSTAGRPVHLAGPLRLDTWAGGTTVQLIIDDAAWPVGS